jgi:hypothetical protein
MDPDYPGRPAKVGHAIRLLYVALGIGVLLGVMGFRRLAARTSIGYALFINLMEIGVMWLFIHMIGKGRNWARVTFLVLFILGVPFTIQPLLDSLAPNSFSGVLYIAQV